MRMEYYFDFPSTVYRSVFPWHSVLRGAGRVARLLTHVAHNMLPVSLKGTSCRDNTNALASPLSIVEEIGHRAFKYCDI